MTELLIYLSVMVIFTTFYCIFQQRIAPSKEAIDKLFEKEVKTKFEALYVEKSLSFDNHIRVIPKGYSTPICLVQSESNFDLVKNNYSLTLSIQEACELHYIIDNFKQIYDKL